MMCPHCEKANPEDAKICVWCGAPLASEEAASPAVKRRRPRWMIVTAAVLAAVVTVVSIGAVMIGKRDREGLLGTWRIDVPVGRFVEQFVDDTDEAMTPLSAMLVSAIEDDVTVTVSCRFYGDDTYTVFAAYEDVQPALARAVDGLAAYMCTDGLFAVLERRGIEREQAELVLRLLNVSEEQLTAMASEQAQEWMQPLYDKLKTALAVADDGTGERVYEQDGDRVFLALEKGKPLDESLYAVLSFDGATLRFVTGTTIDRYLTDLVWTKAEE